jgi:hypothetical protein
MRQYGSYRLEHFMSPDFTALQFFTLLELINLEKAMEAEQRKEMDRKNK